MRNNLIIHKIFNIVVHNKLLLHSYMLDSDEFDSCNDKISRLYKRLKSLCNLSYKQIDRIVYNLLKRI